MDRETEGERRRKKADRKTREIGFRLDEHAQATRAAVACVRKILYVDYACIIYVFRCIRHNVFKVDMCYTAAQTPPSRSRTVSSERTIIIIVVTGRAGVLWSGLGGRRPAEIVAVVTVRLYTINVQSRSGAAE